MPQSLVFCWPQKSVSSGNLIISPEKEECLQIGSETLKSQISKKQNKAKNPALSHLIMLAMSSQGGPAFSMMRQEVVLIKQSLAEKKIMPERFAVSK